MNAIKLLELAVAVAPLMPSEAAIPHAAIEWRLARAAWLAALEELNLTESWARERASSRLSLRDGSADLASTERMQ